MFSLPPSSLPYIIALLSHPTYASLYDILDAMTSLHAKLSLALNTLTGVT